jgi:hypothetical protein
MKIVSMYSMYVIGIQKLIENFPHQVLEK